jgi:hypothetical protein
MSILFDLSACGLVDEGLGHFDSMGFIHSICTTPEHNACIVDLPGCTGHPHESEHLIETMHCKPDGDTL